MSLVTRCRPSASMRGLRGRRLQGRRDHAFHLGVADFAGRAGAGFSHLTNGYSCRRATVGFKFAAQRAGIQHASNAMPVRSTDTATNVSGSVGFTP